MKDAYSFHKDGESLNEVYQKMHQSYLTIFARCGLKNVISLEADTGIMGGSESTEYMVLSESGEDKVKWCNSCKKGFSLNVESCPLCKDKLQEKSALEVGHIFKLGVKYSKTLELYFLDKDGSRKPVVMGCYGIGVGRTVAAAIEQNHDEKGIVFPIPISPFEVTILPLQIHETAVTDTAEKIYADLLDRDIDALIDDRDERAGVKFNDADLLGIPVRVTVGLRGVRNDQIELKLRAESESIVVPIEDATASIQKKVKDLYDSLK